MTDEQYQAKNWLMRIQDYAGKVDAARRTLEMLEHRLHRGVMNYEGYTGRRDPITAQAAHDDALMDYSMQAERLEQAQREYFAVMITTREVLEVLPMSIKPLAIDRYINGLNWQELEKIYEYSRPQLYRFNSNILTQVAEVLNIKKTELTITANPKSSAQHELITSP